MRLSIITVTLNSKKTIISTLNSILSQTYEDIEHIIVDGGSTDGTVEILKEYNHYNKKIIFKEGAGIYESMNLGIVESTGEIISILKQDIPDDAQTIDNFFDDVSSLMEKKNISVDKTANKYTLFDDAIDE